jgi:cysteinyl-tRNA synthetase
MRLYDTLTRSLLELPRAPGPIRMYFCGPTVYQRIHIGNAVPFVLSMWLKRWLALSGYETTLVINITDINDKIYDAAPGESASLAERATQWYLDDTDRLGLGRPDVEPTAVGTVPDQIEMIEQLIAAGNAYESAGDVYFRVRTYADYGRLSRQKLDEVREQEANPRKEDPRDFALWKANKPEEDTWWESPWGKGRPGWHIECSAMSEKHLGTSFEIHGGGMDLVFPHHENEIAQSRSLGHDFARIWMHNGMLSMGGEEMHKSAGNAVLLSEVLDRFGCETVLLFFMTGQWRKPLDFSEATLTAARAQAETLRNALRGETRTRGDWQDFASALEDDFNTPAALAILHEWARAGALEELRRGLDVFGLASLGEQAPAPPEVVTLADARVAARTLRDFAEADRLRDEIAERGWEVRDVASGYELVPRS